ncbi:MAG: thioredoxin family protein [Fluviicola sp.]|nr:MAG: thioredoxin family protein [Fluviicola sp.]
MNKIFIIALIISFSIIGMSFLEDNKLETLSIGSKAPLQDLTMKSTSGKKLDLKSQLKDNGLIVVFSCNTCPFVIGGENFPGWEKDYNELSALSNQNSIGFVLINSNEAKRKKGDGMKDMIERSKEKDFRMPYLYDAQHKLADAFGAKTTPHIFMFDKDMVLIYEGSIDNTWKPKVDKKETYLIDAINSHSNNEKIKLNKTAPKGCSIKRKS